MSYKRFTFFQFFTFAVFFVFMVIMCIVVLTAYSRRSGSTELSMSKVQQMRFDVSAKQQKEERESTLASENPL